MLFGAKPEMHLEPDQGAPLRRHVPWVPAQLMFACRKHDGFGGNATALGLNGASPHPSDSDSPVHLGPQRRRPLQQSFVQHQAGQAGRGKRQPSLRRASTVHQPHRVDRRGAQCGDVDAEIGQVGQGLAADELPAHLVGWTLLALQHRHAVASPRQPAGSRGAGRPATGADDPGQRSRLTQRRNGKTHRTSPGTPASARSRVHSARRNARAIDTGPSC